MFILPCLICQTDQWMLGPMIAGEDIPWILEGWYSSNLRTNYFILEIFTIFRNYSALIQGIISISLVFFHWFLVLVFHLNSKPSCSSFLAKSRYPSPYPIVILLLTSVALCSVWSFMIIKCFVSLTQYSFIVITLLDKASNGWRGGVTT